MPAVNRSPQPAFRRSNSPAHVEGFARAGFFRLFSGFHFVQIKFRVTESKAHFRWFHPDSFGRSVCTTTFAEPLENSLKQRLARAAPQFIAKATIIVSPLQNEKSE
jgi:hypothetical protein